MLNHTVLTMKDLKSGGLDKYHFEGADDYYAKEGESRQWQGGACEILGITGDIDQAVYSDLLRGKLPGVDQQLRLSSRDDSKLRVGIDFEFAPPKSISMQALAGKDPVALAAHDRAVSRVLIEMEKLAQTRIKRDGKSYVERTGNLAVAKYRHETNREGDPHLHTHCIVMNFTMRSDGQWRALVNDDLVKRTKFFGALYRSELATELKKAGYELRMEGDSFELAHISRAQILEFSNRSAQIEKVLAERGLTRATATTEEKQQIAYSTRRKKDITDRESVMSEWQSISKALGIDYASRERAYDSQELAKAHRNEVDELASIPKEEMARRSVRFAINHFSERSAIIGVDDVMKKALEHGMQYCTLPAIQDQFNRLVKSGTLVMSEPQYTSPNDKEKRALTRTSWIAVLRDQGADKRAAAKEVDKAIASGRLVKTGDRVTTQNLIDMEKRMLARELAGRGVMQAIMKPEIAKIELAAKGASLRPDQLTAADMLLTSTNRITGIQGLAGVGKSYLLKTAIPVIEQTGHKVILLAPYGSQVKDLRSDGLDAKTVAAFLNTKSREHGIDEKTVIVIDEAGVVPNRLMDRITDMVEKAGARVVLLGDTGQTKAIEAGIPFALMQRQGMQTALMDDIQRQKDNPTLLQAVKHSAAGKATEALSLIDAVSEIKDSASRYKLVADDYCSLAPGVRKETLVLSGTNESRQEINKHIREGLGVVGKGREVESLIRWDSTQAERRFAKYYEIGDIIQPEINYPRSGLKRYEDYTIVDRQGNKLTLKDKAGGLHLINPSSHKKLSVYRLVKQEYAVGDNVKITRNDASLDLANGDQFKVSAIAGDSITLDNGERTIKFDTSERLHIDYAYCSTVHSAQGLTASNVIANIEAASRTTGKDWFYVAISRAKSHVRIYTESAKKLPAAVSRASEKTAAIDIATTKDKEKSQHHEKMHKSLGL